MTERKQRKLTDAERQRLDRFNATCEDLDSRGYRRVDLRVGMATASVVAAVATLVMLAVCLPLFLVVHPEAELLIPGGELIASLVVFVVLVVAHELVHGLTWSRFAPGGLKDISFGVMWNSLSPYCTCLVPLSRGPYVLGTLMPLVVFGLIPLVAAFAIGNAPMLYIGILMTVSATGDVMIAAKALRYHTAAAEVLVYDHPTDAGSLIFER